MIIQLPHATREIEQYNKHLVGDSDVSIGKGVGSQHSGDDVVVFVHVHVLLEGHLGQLTIRDIFKVGSHLKEIQIWTVTTVEEGG